MYTPQVHKALRLKRVFLNFTVRLTIQETTFLKNKVLLYIYVSYLEISQLEHSRQIFTGGFFTISTTWEAHLYNMSCL